MILSFSIFLLGGGILATPIQGQQLSEDNSREKAILEMFGVPVKPDKRAPHPVPDPDPVPDPVPVPVPRRNDSCTCVPHYLCVEHHNTNGEGIIDIRINDRPCESNLEVCCKKEDQVEHFAKGCGVRNPGLLKISGGSENNALFGEIPWMVAVLKEESFGIVTMDTYQCGGALIHPQMVVTVAHCVNDTSKAFKIRAGEWDSGNTNELYPHQDREVQTVRIHPEFNKRSAHNDIALLYLKSHVEISNYINTICLPPADTVLNSSSCLVTGWGKDKFGESGEAPDVPKIIDLPIVPNKKCQQQLRTTRLGRTFRLHNSFICAGGEVNNDSCTGDGGGPLVCLIEGEQMRYFQAGIVSWGIGCRDNIPGVYVNIPFFRKWIDTQMKSFGLGTSTYQY